MMAAQPGPCFPNLLIRNRNFLLLWLAAGVAAIGDHLSEMALLYERGGLERDDVTRVQALLSFGFFLPYVLLAPLTGWWADRFNRKWTMFATDLLRAAVAASLIVSVPLLIGWRLGDYAIMAPLVLIGSFAAFFSPCRQAMVPTLIRDDQLVRANAMISAIGTIGAIVSGWLGGLLVDLSRAGHFDLHWNYLLNGGTFLVSAVLLSMISMRRTRVVPHPPLEGLWQPMRAGFLYVARHRRVLQVILLGTVFWAAAGVVVSVVPAIVREVFHGSASDVGIYRGMLAVGLVLGSALMTWFGPALPTPLAVLWGLLGGGIGLLALDAIYILKLGRALTAAGLIFIGLHGAVILVSVMVVIQHFVPDSRRGRVCGVSDMCTMAAIVTATGLLGLPAIPHLDRYIPWLLAGCGVGMLTALAIAFRIYLRGVRKQQAANSFPPSGPVLQVIWWLVRFYAHFWCRLRREGVNTIPRDGPVILAANHTAGIDPIVLQATTTHRLIGFLVEKKYYDVPVANWFMRLVHCVPVDRENPGRSFYSGCIKMLKQGGTLGIFPQGTFERPGQASLEAKAGVGALALRTGAPVVPCHISGTRFYENPFRAFFSRHEVRVRFGPVIDLSAYAGRDKEKGVAEEVADLIMRKVFELAPAAPPPEPAPSHSAAAMPFA